MTPLTRCVAPMICAALLSVTWSSASAQDDLLQRLNKDTASVVASASKSTVGVRIGRSYGTGFVVGERLVMTSTGVLKSASRNITLYLHDASTVRAQVVAIDQRLCAVLLKIQTKRSLQPLAWARSAKVGTGIFTLGNPYGTIQTTQRIAASFGNISSRYRVTGDKFYDGEVIEISAAVNRGSFGGPVINTSGELIGMVHRSVNYKRWFGVAIPARPLRNFVKRYKSGQTTIESTAPKPSAKAKAVIPGFFGVKVESVKRGKRKYIRITAIAPNSPAEQAGFKVGDFIVQLNRLPIRSQKSFSRVMGVLKAGQVIVVGYVRPGQRRTQRMQRKRVLLSTIPW